MQSLRETSISQIKAVPGLFISDRFAARSVSLLKSLNIQYILSVTRPEDLPKFNSQDEDKVDANAFNDKLVMKHIDINDDPTEDILCHLQDACDWIERGLLSRSDEIEVDSTPQVGILVHCTQGISRSGSFIIAYLMRKLSLDYSSALALARESRPLISPNPGFEYQLRIWRFCEYDVYVSDSSPEVQSLLHEEKEAYRAWKLNRDEMLGRGEEAINKARFASMASLAANFGKRRIQRNEESKEEMEEQGKEMGEGNKKQMAWENVEKMEQEWTRRLITGTYPPWEEKQSPYDTTAEEL